MADFLIVGQRLIGAFDRGSGIRSRSIHQEYRVGLRVSVTFEPDDDTISDVWLRAQGSFQILGVNIHACRCDDDIFSPALEIQAAILVLLCDIPCSEPSICVGDRLNLAMLLICSSEIFAAHENFAVVVDTHFHAWKHFAD